MTDYFALLGEARRPWLERDSLKQKFVAYSAELHPDRLHNAGDAAKRAAQERYTELNAAYQCLREPKSRLQQLLELERGVKAPEIQSVPAGLMDVFLEVSAVCREADGFLAENGALASPLLKVQMFERGQGNADKLSGLQKRLHDWQAELLTELKRLDTLWMEYREAGPESRAAALNQLEELGRLFGYCGRWSGQIQERIVQLALAP